MTTTLPIGTRVQYTLSADDAKRINERRAHHGIFTRTLGAILHTGHQGSVGNGVSEGTVVAADVVAVFGPTTCNLQLILDGVDSDWATSVAEGTGPRTWQRMPDQTTQTAPEADPQTPSA